MLGLGTLIVALSQVAVPPTIASLNYDLADIGDAIAVTGTSLTGATTCTVGGASAPITANTPTSVVFTMPAIVHAAMPSFDGVDDHLEHAGPVTSFVVNTAGSIGVLFYARTAGNAVTAATKYTEAALFGDDNGNLSLSVANNNGVCEVSFSSYNGVDWNSVTVQTTFRAWHYVQARWNETTKEIRIDGGEWVTLAHAVANLSPGLVHIGRQFNTLGRYYDGTVAHIMTEASRWLDTTADDLVRYINARFRQNLGGLGTGAYDPAVRSLTCWLEAGDFAANTWTAKASAGTSGTRSFTQASNPPSSSTPPWTGFHAVTVTTALGTSNALTIELWDPTAEPAVTLLFDSKHTPYDAISGTWVPRYTVVPGYVLPNNTAASGYSANVASVDGAPTFDGNGVNEAGLGNDGSIATWNHFLSAAFDASGISARVGSLASVFSSTNIQQIADPSAPYNTQGMAVGSMNAGSGIIGQAFGRQDSGDPASTRITTHIYDVGYKVASAPATPAERHAAVSRWGTTDGDVSATLDLSVDGALTGDGYVRVSPVIGGTFSSYTSYPITVGTIYPSTTSATQWFVGQVPAFAILNAKASDEFITKWHKWSRSHLGVA